MTDTTYNVIKLDNGVPIKGRSLGSRVEDAAREKLASGWA